jgi:2-oxoisovalerate dehydrogenase E1 component alpha subunit
MALMLCMGLTPTDFMMGLMGKKGDPSSGGRQIHSQWSFRRNIVVTHSAPVATQTPHASGIGLTIKLRGEDKVVLIALGEEKRPFLIAL